MKIKILTPSLLTIFLISLTSCTQPGETTTVAAATGGVIGAGLGAIIGNQTGDAGAGVAIGAVAGASTGALVGNALQAHEESIRAQDEAIERNDKLIAAQRREMHEIRGARGDSPSLDRKIKASLNNAPLSERNLATSSYASNNLSTGSVANDVPVYRGGKLHAPASAGKMESIPVRKVEHVKDNIVGEHTTTAAASYNWDQKKTLDAPGADKPMPKLQTASKINQVGLTGECREGFTETEKANQSSDTADKLLHYRRALRLCPSNPDFHNGLGELYLSLNRKEDAEFEFKEALNLDPNHAAANSNLQSTKKTAVSKRF